MPRPGAIRAQLISDLHLERSQWNPLLPNEVATNADVIVAPGALARGTDSISALCALFPSDMIVATGGNHEHYLTGTPIEPMHEQIRAAAAAANDVRPRPIFWLENSTRVEQINGIDVRFVGCTLWTDYALQNDVVGAMRKASMCMNDHRLIMVNGGLIATPQHLLAEHQRSHAFLRDVLAHPHDGPTVVLTHHLPHSRSIAREYRGDGLNASFASDLDNLFAFAPTLWVHGHTHSSCRWRHKSGTLVCCNPVGYQSPPRWENPRFDPKYVIDIRRGGPDRRWTAGMARRPISRSDRSAETATARARS